MSRRVRVAVVGMVLALLLSSAIAACGGAKEEPRPAEGGKPEVPAALNGKALTEERCVKCHDLERVNRAQKTADEWKTSVERMVSKGAELNQAEQEAVIEYLSKP